MYFLYNHVMNRPSKIQELAAEYATRQFDSNQARCLALAQAVLDQSLAAINRRVASYTVTGRRYDVYENETRIDCENAVIDQFS